MTAFETDAAAVSINAANRAVFDELMACSTSGANPMGNDFVAADGTSGGFEQSGEIGFWFQREALCDLSSIQGFIGNALIVHHFASAGDRSFDRLFIPAFSVEQKSMGVTQNFTGMGLFFPPKAIGFLRETAEHWVGIHFPEHSGFAKAAGSGMGQCFAFKKNDVADSSARE
jgi:hypothetical protein